MDAQASRTRKSPKITGFGVARSAALLAILLSVANDAEARGFGGGGFRGGGSMSMSRGGSFSRGSSSFGRGSFERGSGSERGSKGTFTRGGEHSKPSDSTRPGQGGSGTQIGGGDRPSQLPSGGGSGRPIDPGNRPGGGGSGTERPTHPISCPGCGGSGTEGWFDHPIAAGVVIGAAATAIAIGATYYALPPGCPPYYWNSFTYYSCDGIYYEPQYEGDTIVYVTVPDPSGGQQQPPPKQ